MKVKVPVVGIRNYLENAEDDLDKLFARLPIGSVVFLSKEPTGSEFPGSVSVWDGQNKRIGSVSKTERRFIELEIPEGEMLPVKISGHSKEHKCMFVTAENTKGIKKPYIRQIVLEPDETTFSKTDHDQRLLQLTSLMKTKLRMLKDGMENDSDSLLATAREYVEYCCTSLDGETSFSRSDILIDLSLLIEAYPELEQVHSDIYEKHKDIGRRYNDVKTKAYLDQYNRIKESALAKAANGRSQFDDYLEKLKFSKGGIINKEIVDEEILRLSNLLANEMMKSYEKSTETDEKFATALYSLNYSLNGIYRLYTRQIKLEKLKELSFNDEGEVNNQLVEELHQADVLKALGIEMEIKKDGKVIGQQSADNISEGHKEEMPGELCHFVYPGLDDMEAQNVHKQISDLVRRCSVPDICAFLKKLKEEKKVLLPQNPQSAFDELHRMGLPPAETKGFGYDNFRKYYNK